MSAAVAGVLCYAASRSLYIAGTALLSAAAGSTAWNAVLRATHADEFFTDAPITVMPASWQDAGSGILTFTLAAAILGLGPLAHDGRRAVGLAATAAAAAFLVDVYLY